MQYKFLNIFLDPKELLAQAKNKLDVDFNKFLLENNSSQVEKIYDFFKGNINLLYVNGFLGTGKASVVEYSTAFLSEETIILKYNCFNSTVLDDILLSFFVDFKKLSAQNIISEPKIKTENFTQKINSYFSQIEKPFVIILDSFEAILEENRQEILDFIFHLNSMPKIKIIIIGRTFESKYFKEKNIERISTFAFEPQICEKYLKSEKIKFSGPILDEFYKFTHGYYFFNQLSVKIMKKDDLPLFDFLMKYKESFLPFQDFLGKQALNFVPVAQKNLFWFLSIIRHPINVELLKKLNLYNEEAINIMKKNLMLLQDDSHLYVSDFIKERVENSMPLNVQHKIRQYIVDLYLTQLPLKPMERDICISRQTMRKEIEFHKFFLPKKPKNAENIVADINYLSYAKVIDFGEKKKSENENDNAKEEETKKVVEQQSDIIHKKNININLENLPYQDKPKTIDKNNSEKNDTQSEEGPSEYDNLTLKEIIERAKQAEERYNYAKVIDLYKRALLMQYDVGYQFYLPMIYTKIAHAFEKVANYEKSLMYYELAKDVYQKAKDFVKVSYIKFGIAKILYETYKIDKAKDIFNELIKSQHCPAVLVVKSYLQLANIEEGLSNSQNAFEYYELALEKSDSSMDVETLSELYFKYALAMDDKNDSKTAIEFYTKCIQLSENTQVNRFLSPTYSNIANLYLEKNDTENATINYSKAFEIDKQNSNLEGMYDSSSRLASILQKKQPEKALEFFQTALDCANLTKDVFYIVSASLAIGDFHYNQKQNEIALKYYLKALDFAQNSFSQDNLNKINIRINDIKFRLGVKVFEELVELIREKENE